MSTYKFISQYIHSRY